MNKKQNNFNLPLLGNIPSIDLHGETRETASFLVKQFIDDSYKLKNDTVIIIHGIGTGILRKEVHNLLKKDKRIEKFYIDFFNAGCTIVKFKDIIWQKICFML